MNNLLKFNKPPLIDAVIEFRFDKSEGLLNIMPGLLNDIINLHHLPLNNIPFLVRQADPNLKYAPIMRLELDKYLVLLGDNVLAIACKLPYPGWNTFKITTKNILENINKSSLSKNFIVNRISIKYIDFLDSVKDINLKFELGNFTFDTSDSVIIKNEVHRNEIIHGIQIFSNATVNSNGLERKGAILDIDSIKFKNVNFNDFLIDIDTSLDAIHTANKDIFIELLKKETIEKLEPIYE